MTRPPAYAHQTKGVELLLEAPAFALACRPGTGKSKMIIDEAAVRWEAEEIDLLAVVAPNGVDRKWLNNEVPLHCGAPTVTHYFASGKDRGHYTAMLKRMRKEPEALHVAAIGYGALSRDTMSARAFFAAVKAMKTELVIDESTRIKHPGAIRTKTVLRGGKTAPLRRILSGSLWEAGVEGAWTQFNFLDPKILSCKTYALFKARFCRMGGFENRQIVGYHDLDELRALVAPYVYEVEKEDCLDLPPKRYERLTVSLSPEQRRHYETLKKEFFVTLGTGEQVDVAEAVVRLLRLQQIVGGHLPDGTPLPCPRLDETLDRVQADVESGESVVVWAKFAPEIRRMDHELRRRGVPVRCYTGQQNERVRDADLRLFQDDVPAALLGTQGAGGIGLDMTRGSRTYYYSESWSAEDRLQSEDRNHRIGQRNSVIYTDLHADRTTDALVKAAITRRQSTAEIMSRKNLQALLG